MSKRITLSQDETAELEALLRVPIGNGRDLIKKVRPLVSIQMEQYHIELPPALLERLAHRAPWDTTPVDIGGKLRQAVLHFCGEH